MEKNINNFVRFILCLYIPLSLISCATSVREEAGEAGDTVLEQTDSHQTSNLKYAAWKINDIAEHAAINGLLREADLLIAGDNINVAEDKLERVLRIKPDYAPAWSRLSWLALKTNAPERSVQMAKRSNSFAYADIELQMLNWTFIRAASQQLNDDETYFQANQKIESLKSF